MRLIIARGRPGVPSLAAMGVAASLVLSACSIPFRSAEPEPDDGAGVASSAPAEAPTGAGEPTAATPTAPASETTEPGAAPTGTATSTPAVPDTGADGPDEPGAGVTDGDSADDPPPFFANTLPDFGGPTGGPAGTLVDVRMGGHDGFDRVVFEFEGPGTPGWHVRYVDWVVGDPSGEALEVSGAAVLEVTVDGVAYPEPGGPAYDGPSRVRIAATRSVTETLFNSIFEGQLQAFIGVGAGELPFRAYRLTSPSRLVVEVETSR